jgi:hypothetical protein
VEVIVERPAALDARKAQVTACVRLPAGTDGRAQEVAEFATTVRGLLTLHDWLSAYPRERGGHGGDGRLLRSPSGRSLKKTSSCCS